MSDNISISSAGNTLPSALGCLRELGFVVTFADGGQTLQAERAELKFTADDPLALLGLVKLYELRGTEWRPTQQEVEAFLELVAQSNAEARSDR